MGALGQWRRKAFGAAGATVIAPAAVILAALAVGIAGGGLKGLGSLGQALTGPTLPVAAASDRSASEHRKRADEGSELLAAAESAREARSDPQRGTPRDDGSDQPTATTPGRRPGSGDGGNNGNPGNGNPQPPPSSTPPPSGTPEPSVIRTTGDQVKEVVQQAPIVGDTGAAVVETLVTTADEVCPPPVCPQK